MNDTYKIKKINFFLMKTDRFYILEVSGYKFNDELFNALKITKEEFTSIGYSFHIDRSFCKSCNIIRYFSKDKDNFDRFFAYLGEVMNAGNTSKV